MSLDIGDALRDGASRTAERNALALMAAFVALGLASTVVMQSFYASYFEFVTTMEGAPAGFEQPATPLALPLPIGLTLGLWLVVALVAEAVRIVAVRVMVSDVTDSIPGTLVARNLPLAVVNGFVGGIVVSVLVGLGTLIFVLPGIFLAISFFFVRQRIAVEDENFVDAMVASWELSSGDRVELAVLALALFAVALVALVPTVAFGAVFGQSSPVPQLLQSLVGGPVAVFGVAVAARAYVQLTEEPAEGATADEDDDEGGDDEEWPDPPGVDV